MSWARCAQVLLEPRPIRTVIYLSDEQTLFLVTLIWITFLEQNPNLPFLIGKINQT